MTQRLKQTMEALQTQMVKLREAEEKYHGIFRNVMEGIFQSTPEGHFLSANPAMATILGYDSPEALMLGVKPE